MGSPPEGIRPDSHDDGLDPRNTMSAPKEDRVMTKKPNRAVVIFAATLAAVLLAAAPQAAVALDQKQERCLAKAARAVGHAIDRADYAIQLGTSGRDRFSATAEQDLICGFGGSDSVKPGTPPLALGDIFIGGPGYDVVKRLDGGIVIGGRGSDRVKRQVSGRFDGGRGKDFVRLLRGGTFRGEGSHDSIFGMEEGTFIGGGGPDEVFQMLDGDFDGGAGRDLVVQMFDGVFDGGAGSDQVLEMIDGVFDGGTGTDAVIFYEGGTLISVEECEEGPCP
jgi:hypothetical protein